MVHRLFIGSTLVFCGFVTVFAIGGIGVAPIDAAANDTFGGFEQDGRLNETEIEQEIHEQINKERTARGLSKLDYSRTLQEPARFHSKDMANNTYFSHTSPNGQDFQDRYARFGVACSIRVDNTEMLGGENIAYTYADSNVDAPNGGSVNYYGNETKIAQGIVTQWMHSEPHRNNIIEPYWNAEAIGVATAYVDGKQRVYATQNFC